MEKVKEQARVDETAGLTAAALLGTGNASAKKEDKGESVKLKGKPTKSVAELELLVESLKRVIEKQKTESDALKRELTTLQSRGDKLVSEKQLRQRIEALEQELHSYEMKDVNVGEKDKTIKKLVSANREMRDDLEREVERYRILEVKY